MPGYWWECEGCGKAYDFPAGSGHAGIPHYVRDALIPSNWNQELLIRECRECGEKALRIAYEYPRSNKESLRVLHIVGLGEVGDDYIPMMWVSLFSPYNGDPCFDFKRLLKKSPKQTSKNRNFVQW